MTITQPALDIKAIMRRLPHRYPFLMVDRVLQYGGSEVVALKNVTLNEGFFSGHFPGIPVMPGVMIAESMAQSAAFLGASNEGNDTPVNNNGIADVCLRAFLTSLNLKLKRPVVPGDQLLIRATTVKRMGKMLCVSATASVEGHQVACAEFTVALR